MDKTVNYRTIVQKVLQDFVALREANNSPIQTQVLLDTTNDHYQVLRTGWRDGKQVFNVIFHKWAYKIIYIISSLSKTL